ncbi:hypothetical protein [Gulosibacter molinativorax]|uniref:Uncharacterized protein n=1 Tax=Gulosibacter molinativorax TaxID=256821 RepID=A0ABT7C621_9MICO|nr:hypothetical protein [Gulosibacter molinativorax]MDJ1370658.1 hypothetical protein [Gulosibacter molinativorax]QUY63316.1 Hypotetical protein [Gulosibacter molinativorax]
MARDRANIFTDIWADQDWRELSVTAQHLYLLMLTHGTLNYAGVMDWHPGRLAAMSDGRAAADVERDGAELEAGGFVLIDTDTGEGLVRSFLKHDGVLKQPKIVVSMTNAFASVASKKIRQVIAFEVQKLQVQQPELRAWEVKQVRTILEFAAASIHEVTPGLALAVTPGFTPGVTPNGDQAQGLPTTTATTTATSISNEIDIGEPPKQKRKPEHPIPADWSPNESAVLFAQQNGLDLRHEAGQFVAHAHSKERRLRNWDAGFRTWLGNAVKWRAENRRLTPTERAAQTVSIGRAPLATDLQLGEIA